ncbi:hypothetical protein [Dietzia sp.]|uniref:hypothetical protein n=1 Tax=Dietzia sp. TaxID=1871616 RepID=UPI002FDB0498
MVLRPKGDGSTTASGATASPGSSLGGASVSGTPPTEEPDALLPPSSDESLVLPEETTFPPGPLWVRHEVESSSSDVTVTYVPDDAEVELEEVSSTWSTGFTSDSTPYH